jgi:molybdate transport system substrate-binding protein
MIVKILTIYLLISFNTFSKERVLVFAASSVSSAMKEIVEKFEKQSSLKVTLSYASSSSLARQIERGAPADIFISAHNRWVDYLIDKRVLKKEMTKDLLGNSLVLIAPSYSKVKETVLNNGKSLSKVLQGERLACANTSVVPAGIYAKKSLEGLGLWNQLENKLSNSKSVRAALALVERGESPLGIVYKSDALISNKVKVISNLPLLDKDKIRYSLALISFKNEGAIKLFDFLNSNEARIILKKYGFNTL